jgi:glycerol-3-phosphate dehydrogenase
MKRDLSTLSNNQYDLVVIGAGAFGSCAAWDAASRGLSVALIDRGDFCNATTANYYKFVHGGIRYLQHGDVYRVLESCNERSALLRIAPHLVKPIPIVMPTYGYGMKGKAILRLGLLLYDLLTLKRNKNLPSKSQAIPFGKILSRKRVVKLFPFLEKNPLNGAGLFYDAQVYNPTRLVISFLRSAAEAGAHLGNYLEAIDFLKNDEQITGVQVRDVLSGNSFGIRGKVVINAAGPWAPNLLKSSLNIDVSPTPSFSRDLAIVLNKRITGKYTLACQVKYIDPDALLSRKGRHVFLSPWRDFSLLGVWHYVHKGDPDNVGVNADELQSYLDEINDEYPDLSLSLDDISTVNFGLTLFGENTGDSDDLSFGKRSILIDHSKTDGLKGLITLIGVRATTARGMAEKSVNLASVKLKKKIQRSSTTMTPIFGGDSYDFDSLLSKEARHYSEHLDIPVFSSLLRNYGTQYTRVLRYANEQPALFDRINNTLVIKAEIAHAILEEMAVTLSDIVLRRTDLATGKYPGDEALRVCAETAAEYLNWDDNRINEEVSEVKQYFSTRTPVRQY